MNILSPEKAPKKLSKKQEAYLRFRMLGHKPQKAYKLAGYKGKDLNSGPYHIERSLQRFLLTRDDLLERARDAVKKIFDDFLQDKPGANVAAVTRLIAMQQIRIDPPVRKIQAKVTHEVIGPEVSTQIEQDYEALLQDLGESIGVIEAKTSSI
jgi:hypothetical protein